MVQSVICVKNENHGFHPTPYFNIRETGAKSKWELLQGRPGVQVPRLSLRAWLDRLGAGPRSRVWGLPAGRGLFGTHPPAHSCSSRHRSPFVALLHLHV